MLRVRLAFVMVVIGASLSAGAQVIPAPKTVDFDTFMQQDVPGRIRTFGEITPENRADLVQTLIKRWVEKNRSRLTPDQLKIMDENLAFVTADRYRQPMDQEQRNRLQELEARTAAVFSREDMREALTIYATYIPKKS